MRNALFAFVCWMLISLCGVTSLNSTLMRAARADIPKPDGGGAGEVGDGKVVGLPRPDPAKPGQKPGQLPEYPLRLLSALYSSERVGPGDSLWVSLMLEPRDPAAVPTPTACTAYLLRSASFESPADDTAGTALQIPPAECRVRVVAQRRYRVELRYDFPRVTEAARVFVGSPTLWFGNKMTSAAPIEGRVISVVASPTRPPLQLVDAWLDKKESPARMSPARDVLQVRLGEVFELIVDVRSDSRFGLAYLTYGMDPPLQADLPTYSSAALLPSGAVEQSVVGDGIIRLRARLAIPANSNCSVPLLSAWFRRIELTNFGFQTAPLELPDSLRLRIKGCGN